MAEASGEITCPACGKTGRPQQAPIGDDTFCPYCGALSVEATFLRITAPGIAIEMRPDATKASVEIDDLASGAATATGLTFGGPAGLIVGFLGSLFGGGTAPQSRANGPVTSPLRPGALRTAAIIGLVAALVLGFVASPEGSVFLSPTLGLFLLGVAYLAWRMRL